MLNRIFAVNGEKTLKELVPRNVIVTMLNLSPKSLVSSQRNSKLSSSWIQIQAPNIEGSGKEN